MNWTIWAGLIGVCATGCWLCWPTIAGWFDPVERARHSPEPGVDRPFGIDAQPDYSAGGYAADKPASKIGPITARVPVQVVDRSGLLLLPRSLTGQLNTPDGNQHVADDDNTAWHARILIARLTDELSMQSPMERVADWIRNADPTAELIHYPNGTYTYPEETNR